MRVSICKSMFGIPLSLYIPLLFFSLCIFIYFLCIYFLILFLHVFIQSLHGHRMHLPLLFCLSAVCVCISTGALLSLSQECSTCVAFPFSASSPSSVTLSTEAHTQQRWLRERCTHLRCTHWWFHSTNSTTEHADSMHTQDIYTTVG